MYKDGFMRVVIMATLLLVGCAAPQPQTPVGGIDWDAIAKEITVTHKLVGDTNVQQDE